MLPLPPAASEIPPDVAIAFDAWNMAGGLNWSALPVISEIYGYDDPAFLVVQHVAIRNWQRDNEES